MSDKIEKIKLSEGNNIPEDQKWLYSMLAEQKKTINKLDKSIQGIIVLIMLTILIVVISR
jgi:hypothetical protein